MATQLCIRRLAKEYGELMKDPLPNIKVYIKEDNLLEWYFCFYGLDGSYTGGEYLGMIKVSDDYPMKPPSIYMYTPNGRFVTNERICTTNSDHHPELWKSTWTLGSQLLSFLSLFTEDNSTGQVYLNHQRTSKKAKKAYAKKSRQYNKATYPDLFEKFNSDQCIMKRPKVVKLNTSDKSDKSDESPPPPSPPKKIKIKLKLKT